MSSEELSMIPTDKEPKSILVKFNLMDYKYRKWVEEDGVQKDNQIRIGYGEETYFGNYDLAERLLHAQYTYKASSRLFKQESR